MAYNEGSKIRCPVFPPSLQSTSGMTQVGLHPQGVRLLRSSAVPQASSDVFAFPQTACSLEQNFTVDDVNTPKVGPIFHCEIRNIRMSLCACAHDYPVNLPGCRWPVPLCKNSHSTHIKGRTAAYPQQLINTHTCSLYPNLNHPS